MSIPESPATTDVVVIGAGPRGVGWLERFAANHASFGSPDVTVHLVDPFPPGPGRIWRHDQSILLRLNSLAEDVTMFTDASNVIDGPMAPGPSLAEWASDIRAGRITDVVCGDADLAEELRRLHGKSFPTRRLQGLYLDWFHRRTLAHLPDGLTVTAHADHAVHVRDAPSGGTQLVSLASGTTLEADVVVYAVGHSGSDLAGEQADFRRFADRHELFYLPPTFTADADLRGIAAGETVIVRGFGLAAIDLLVLLGEGRGGRFERHADRLRYVPSGREPRLVVGSGRGVPYHSKITSTLVAARPEPRYFTRDVAREIAARHPRLDFREHVWPAIAKEMLHGYYAELFVGHPARVRISWDEFVARFDAVEHRGTAYRDLVDETVVDPGDRLDLDRFDRPLGDLDGVAPENLQETIRAYIRDDLARRSRPEHSATLGLFLSLLQAFGTFFTIADAPTWTARSWERDLEGGWLRSFSFVASGPPGHRLEEILALSEAGVLTFLGAGLRVTADEGAGVFRASSASTAEVVTARALVDAWLPAERATVSDNPVLRALLDDGGGLEHLHTDGERTVATGKLTVVRQDARVVRADGTAHPRRFAVGPYTTSPFVGAFSRPRTDALSFRENDAVARAVLRDLTRIPATT